MCVNTTVVLTVSVLHSGWGRRCWQFLQQSTLSTLSYTTSVCRLAETSAKTDEGRVVCKCIKEADMREEEAKELQVRRLHHLTKKTKTETGKSARHNRVAKAKCPLPHAKHCDGKSAHG